MADDDPLLTDDDEQPSARSSNEAAPKSETATSGPKPGAPHLLVRIVLGTAGLLLVVGFFLPWIQLPSESHSGLTLVFEEDRDVRELVGETQRWILLVIPLLGAALTAVGFLGLRWSGIAGAFVGLSLIGYGVVTVVTMFFQRTGLGLWLIVGAAFLALATGIIAWVRARSVKLAASSRERELPEDG